MPGTRLDEDLKMSGDMRQALTAMLARTKNTPDLRDRDELTHFTAELIKSL
jgi:hypothetical protein